MCNKCCVDCIIRDYEACKNCKKDNKIELVITAEDLSNLHTKTNRSI